VSTGAPPPIPIAPDATLSVLIHAPSKMGKSTLSSTAPPPLLVLDAEGGWRFLREAGFKSGRPLRKKPWDPLTGPPPRHDGTWDACVVTVNSWGTLQRVYEWLLTTQHDFISLVADSITEMQRRCKQNIKSDGQMQIQDWGRLLAEMDKLIRGLRDLILLPNNVRVAVFLAETREDKGRYRPFMQGQIGVSLPYWMDVVGYLFVDNELDENGAPTVPVRKLLVGPNPTYESGERVQGMLDPIITRPSITTMLNAIFPPPESPTFTVDVPPPHPLETGGTA
jgi:hypothetical protein